MPIKTYNGALVMVGSDAYALTQDMLEFAKSLNLVIICENKDARDGLPAYEGMVVCRLDLKGAQEVYVNSNWVGPSDHVIAFSGGASTFENVISSIPLRATVRNGMTSLTGRIRRTAGTEDNPTIGYVPVQARPVEAVYASLIAGGGGGYEGSKFNFSVSSSTGELKLYYMKNSAAWDSFTYISLCFTWPVGLLS